MTKEYRTCRVCGEERKTGSEIGGRGRATCFACQKPQTPTTRRCTSCGLARDVGTQISHTGRATCFACQAGAPPRTTRLCTRCGYEREIGTEIGRRGIPTCLECAAEHKRALTSYHTWLKRGVPEGSRLCRRCGMPWQREPKMRAKICGPCRKAKRDAYARVYRVQHREQFIEYSRAYHERVYSDPYLLEEHRAKARENARRARARDPERYKGYDKKTYWNKRNDPKRWRQFLDEQRERTRERKLRRGEPVRVYTAEVYNAKFGFHAGARVDVAPIVDVMNEWLTIDNGHRREALAEAANVSERSIYRMLNGKQTKINVNTADALLAAMDMPLAVVYPEVA